MSILMSEIQCFGAILIAYKISIFRYIKTNFKWKFKFFKKYFDVECYLLLQFFVCIHLDHKSTRSLHNLAKNSNLEPCFYIKKIHPTMIAIEPLSSADNKC